MIHWFFFSNDIFCVDVNSLKDLEVFQPMKTERGFLEAVCLKDNLYVFGGRNNYNSITSVDKYSLTSKTWSHIAEMYDNRRYFCTCAFMNMIFFFGGLYLEVDENVTNSCLQFNTSDCS